MFPDSREIVAAVLLGISALTLGEGASARPAEDEADRPALVRVPNHGIQPQVAVDSKGETILVWKGMGWNRGGSLAWQVFDKNGKPTGQRGQAAGVPVWSLVAAFVRPMGGSSSFIDDT